MSLFWFLQLPDGIAGDSIRDRVKTFTYDFSYDSGDSKSSTFVSQEKVFNFLILVHMLLCVYSIMKWLYIDTIIYNCFFFCSQLNFFDQNLHQLSADFYFAVLLISVCYLCLTDLVIFFYYSSRLNSDSMVICFSFVSWFTGVQRPGDRCAEGCVRGL